MKNFGHVNDDDSSFELSPLTDFSVLIKYRPHNNCATHGNKHGCMPYNTLQHQTVFTAQKTETGLLTSQNNLTDLH